MSENLPAIQVTPAMAIRFARKQQLKVSRMEAQQWLARNRKEIERRLREWTQLAIESALLDITLLEWPDPVFDKVYRLVERAVSQAIEEHEERHNVEVASESSRGDDMQQTVRSFLRHRGTKPKKAWLVLDLSFRERDSDLTADTPEIPYLLELIYQDGKVKATLGERLRHSKAPRPEAI